MNRPRSLTLALGLFLALASSAVAQARDGGATRWNVTGSAPVDFRVAVDSAVAHSGRASMRIVADHEPEGFATLITSLPAAPYAGQRVRLSAYLRTESLSGAGAALWLRADGAAAGSAFITTQGRRAIVGTTPWSEVTVELDVPPDANTLVLGALSSAEGTLWADDFRLVAVANAASVRALGYEPGDSLVPPPRPAAAVLAGSPHEKARAVTARGLDNLVAFARLTGYVRFFHPSDSALGTNWDEFTVRGMRLVERAATADSLAATLRALFAPVAPSVRIYRTGTQPPAAKGSHADSASIVFWQHLGYGAPAVAGDRTRSVYNSMRRLVPRVDGRLPDSIPLGFQALGAYVPVPDPAQPFRADLGAGVSAIVPLALHAAGGSDNMTARPPAATERFAADDRATRLGIVALLWMVPQHFYPYFDVVSTDWPAALRVALAAAAADSTSEQFTATLERLVAALKDGHGSIHRTGTTRAMPDVRLASIGNRVVVTATGDSAAAAGVQRGDELVAVDGRPVAEVRREVEARISGPTPQWVEHVALDWIMRGIPGTTVTLTLRAARQSSPTREVRLTRSSSVAPPEPRPEKIAELRPGIFYVDLDRVTDADVDAALPQLAAARGLVFDMRGYPRQVNTPKLLARLSDSVAHSPRFEIPIVTQPDRAAMRFRDSEWQLQPQQPRLRAKVAFLSGGGAISYAESTLGVVEENRLGEIVGEPSAGTNGNINPIVLPAGYRFVWTGMRVRKRDGTPHHGVGITPTIPVSPTLEDVLAGRDAVLERALDVVEGKGARPIG